MSFHKRAPEVHNRKFARAPVGIRVLEPRFTPTAVYPGMPPDDTPVVGPAPDTTTTVTPPSPTTTTRIPIVSNPPATRITTTTPILDLPTQPVIQTTSTTSSLILLPITQANPDDILTTPISTSSPTSVQLPTAAVKGQTTANALTNLPTASRSVAPAIISSSSSSSASATTTASSSSGVSTGAIIGGIGAGLVGVAAVVFGIFFLARRWRKRSDENAFNADSFRRSAVLMDDPPTHEDTVNRGYNPRPPSMIERKLANSTPVSGFGHPHAGYGATGYGNYGSFAPGQVVSPPPMAASPDSYAYNNVAAMPYNAVSPYAQSPFSPASPVSAHVAPYDSPYSQVAGAVAAGTLNRQLSAGPNERNLTRQASLAAANPAHASVATVESIPANDYVDLTRSSVSPFQAAQYVEISKKLNTEVPVGLATPVVNQYTGEPAPAAAQVPSPFADPEPRQSGELPSPYDQALPSPSRDLDFPAPPSPAIVAAAHARIDSTPPMLPEIRVQPRVSGYDDFPKSQNQFPATPSPLASSFAIQTPPATKSEFATPSAVEVVQAPAPAAAEASKPVQGAVDPAPAPVARAQAPGAEGKKRPDTVYSTMYDDEDAYGGF